MSREEAIELLRNCDKLIRYHPNVRKAIELLESVPAGEFTKKFRASCKVTRESCDITEEQIQNVINNTGVLGLKVRYIEALVNAKEGLEACDRIDRLEAELTAKDELLKKSRDCIRTQNHVGKAQMQFIKEVEQALKEGDK